MSAEAEVLRRAAGEAREHPERFPVRAALAVADWLEDAARAYESFPGSEPGHSLKVARAYLGEAATKGTGEP